MRFKDFYEKTVLEDKELQKYLENRDEKFYRDVANLILEARLYSGLTQMDLAKKIRTQQPSIARIERGLTLPSLSFIFKIAKALNTYVVAPSFGFMQESNVKNMEKTVSSVWTYNATIHVSNPLSLQGDYSTLGQTTVNSFCISR